MISGIVLTQVYLEFKGGCGRKGAYTYIATTKSDMRATRYFFEGAAASGTQAVPAKAVVELYLAAVEAECSRLAIGGIAKG